MIVIDLCAGTHSVSRELRNVYPEATIISYDVDPACESSKIDLNHEFRLQDVRSIDPEALREEVGSPAFVWASPPCTQYSRARSKAKLARDLEGADSIVFACMRIIETLAPARWAMENPGTGLLKDRPVVQRWSDYRHNTTYCMYGFDYMKPTCIWTNVDVDLPRCCADSRCPGFIYKNGRSSGFHAASAQKGPSRVLAGEAWSDGMQHTHVLHRVPSLLIRKLATALPTRT